MVTTFFLKGINMSENFNSNNSNNGNGSNNPNDPNSENSRDNRQNSNNNPEQNRPQNLDNRENSNSYTHGSWDPNDPSRPRNQGNSREHFDSNSLDTRNRMNNNYQNNQYQGYSNYNQSNNGRPNNQQPHYRRQEYDYSYNNRHQHYQNYQPPNYVKNQRRDSNTNIIFAVLLSIFLTATLTGFVVWTMSTNGMLPGTEQNSVIGNQETVNPTVPGQEGETVELEGLGLSIHTDDPDAEATANKLAQTIKLLQDNYYSVLSDEEILEAMSEGVLNAMDSPYTYYLTAEQVREFNESIQGNYSGIGASVRQTELGQFEVAEVFNNSPAQDAGIQNGDIIIAIDGRSVSDFETVQDLAQTVRGEDGTTVNITINRLDEEIEIPVIRGDVVMEVVQTRMLEDNIGYLYVSDFTVTLPEQFELGIQELLSQGAEKIVFDMRNNPGGSAASLISVADSLLDEATIATVRGRDGGEGYSESWVSEEGKIVPEDMTYVVLINENSASAAELFAGTLRDNLGTTIIGRQSFGKGSGTRTYNLVDGSAANVTVFNYFLPDGDLIEGIGLDPDIETEGPSADVLRGNNLYDLTPEEDPDLAEALEYLNEN